MKMIDLHFQESVTALELLEAAGYQPHQFFDLGSPDARLAILDSLCQFHRAGFEAFRNDPNARNCEPDDVIFAPAESLEFVYHEAYELARDFGWLDDVPTAGKLDDVKSPAEAIDWLLQIESWIAEKKQPLPRELDQLSEQAQKFAKFMWFKKQAADSDVKKAVWGDDEFVEADAYRTARNRTNKALKRVGINRKLERNKADRTIFWT